jgi:formamidopyrimidine-DNA glycosylase
MPELPEVASRAKEMQRLLVGKTVAGIDVLQPKCLNVPVAKFKKALTGARIADVSYHGKWLFTETTQGYLLINMGMGGDMLLVSQKELPEKRRVVFSFTDGTALSLSFWWFGYVHYAPEGKLDGHAMSAKLGPNVIDVPKADFREMLKGRKGTVKSFLLDQERIAGIGNAYVHDILFLAKLHPQRKLDTLSEAEVDGLWQAIRDGLLPSLRKGGAWYEKSLEGKPGGFTREDIIVGYREGKPCPNCRTKIVKIRTGSNATFICPKCQPLRKGAAPRVVKVSAAKGAARKPAAKVGPRRKAAAKAAPKRRQAPRRTK